MPSRTIHNISGMKCRSAAPVLILLITLVFMAYFITNPSSLTPSSSSAKTRKKNEQHQMTPQLSPLDNVFSSSSSSIVRAKRALAEQQQQQPPPATLNRLNVFPDEETNDDGDEKSRESSRMTSTTISVPSPTTESATSISSSSLATTESTTTTILSAAVAEESTTSITFTSPATTSNSSDDSFSPSPETVVPTTISAPPSPTPSPPSSALPLHIENALVPTPFPNPPSWTFNSFMPPDQPKNDGMKIGITTILRKEHNYVSDWLKYHLAMGFDRIIIYDNEEEPTYANLIRQEGLSCCVVELDYKSSLPNRSRLDRSAETKVIVKHLPNRLLAKGQKQHEAALEDFRVYHMLLDEFTHVAHFDIDEYLQLNKHENVRDFVKEYLTDEHGILDKKCGAITMNWILMGDNNLKKYSPEPVPIRFTCGGARIHHGMKPFFRTDAVSKLWVHAVYYDHPPVFDARRKKSGWHTCTTDNRTTTDWIFHNGPRDVIQLNHYQAKSWPENLHTRSRGSSVSGRHASSRPLSEIVKWFNTVNLNEAPELRTRNYFLKHVYKLSDEEIKNYPLMEGSQCPTDRQRKK